MFYDRRPMLADTSNAYATWGLIAATTAAVLWSVATLLYRRAGRLLPPVRLNLIKGLVAVVLLGGVVASDWWLLGSRPWSLSWGLLGLMALSGVVGIGIGDTLFFAALNRMGARRMLLMYTLAPAITASCAWPMFGEPLSWSQAFGIMLTCGGVAWVIAERNAGNSDGHVDALGIAFGFGAASFQAAGALMSRHVFEQGEMTAASSAWLRLAAGSLVLFLALPLDRLLRDPGGEDRHHPETPSAYQAAVQLGVGLLLGTVLGVWLQQASFKHANQIGIAATLLATSPLFVLPIVICLGEYVSRRAVAGAVVSVGGIALLYLVSA